MVFKNRGTLFETQIIMPPQPPVRNEPSDTQTKRARNKPALYKPKSGRSGELVVTPHQKKASGSAKRKRHTSIIEGVQDAMADAAAGAMSMDARDAPGSRKKADVKSRKQASDEAESEREQDGEEEVDGDHSADDAAGAEEEEESGDDDDDDDSDSGGSESSKDGSGSGSDTSRADSEAERAGARKLLAASSAQRPKVADKERKKGKKAVVEGKEEGQGNKIRPEKPVKESQQGKKHKPQQNPTVMIVIICDISQSDR